jgi:hypothetical protein
VSSRIWQVIKALVSALAAAVAALLLAMFVAKRSDYGLLAVASAFLFLAALPWVNLSKPGRHLGLVGVVLSFALLLVSSRPFEKAAMYPLPCTGRRGWCELENLLFQIGGAHLAALPFAILGVGLLLVSIRTVWRHSKSGA